MAELRSFIIGVTIAALVLGVAAVAFGAFDGGGGNSPSVKLLGTPPASRTVAPANTRPPTSVTQPAGSTGPVATNTALATATRAAIVTATATAAPLATTAPAPTATTASGVPVATYTTRVSDLRGQVDYLLSNANNPNLDSADWKQNSAAAAQNIQGIASAINSSQPPACLAGAHGTVSSGATQASQAAGTMLSGISANDANAISQAAGALASASQAINAGITAINSSSC